MEQKSYFLMCPSIFAVTTCGSWSWHTSFPWSRCATPTPGNIWLLRDGQGRLAPQKQRACLDRAPFQDQNDYLDLLFWYSLALMIISPVSTVIFPNSETAILSRLAPPRKAPICVLFPSFRWNADFSCKLALWDFSLASLHMKQGFPVHPWSINNLAFSSCLL